VKILLIHTDGVGVIKNKEATSNPQDFPEDAIKMDGLILVAYVSIEDQDTYDTDLIAKQGANVIEEAILLITGFPEKIHQKNEEIREHNRRIENGRIKGKPRKIIELIADRDKYRVDKVLVYPWAHLSKFLSQEANAMEVCPKISQILNEKGIETKFSPFGWYKSFKINCLGHEVAEMYRDVKLYIQPEEHLENVQFFVITPEGKQIKIRMDLVHYAQKNGIKPTAKKFFCSKNTVKLWLKRHHYGGSSALIDRSKKPHCVPHQTSKEVEEQIIHARLQVPC